MPSSKATTIEALRRSLNAAVDQYLMALESEEERGEPKVIQAELDAVKACSHLIATLPSPANVVRKIAMTVSGPKL